MKNFISSMDRKQRNIAKNIIAVFSVILVVAVVSTFVYLFMNKNNNNEENKNTTASSDVVNSKGYKKIDLNDYSKFSEGTILNFGSNMKTPVTIITDLEGISRESRIVAGKPSALLTKLSKKKAYMNLYLVPKDDSQKVGVDSVIKAAACKIGSDDTKTNIKTLISVVNAAGKMKGDEDVKAVASMMGMDPNTTECPPEANSSAVSTENNAKYFLNKLDVNTNSVIIVGDEVVTDVSKLKPNWVSEIKPGVKASDLVVGGEENKKTEKTSTPKTEKKNDKKDKKNRDK